MSKGTWHLLFGRTECWLNLQKQLGNCSHLIEMSGSNSALGERCERPAVASMQLDPSPVILTGRRWGATEQLTWAGTGLGWAAHPVAFRSGCATQSRRLRRPSATVSKSHLPGLVSTRQGSKQRSCKCPVGIQLIFLRTTVQQLEWLKNEETLSTGRICTACWRILLQGPSETNQTWDFHHVTGCNIYSLTLFLFFIKPFVFRPFLLRPRKKPVPPPSPCPARPAEQDPTALWINTYLEPLGAFTHTAIHRSAEPTRAFLR